MFIVPELFLKKLIKDQMFVSSFNVGASALISVPICLFIPLIVLWITTGFWWALGYFILFPVMFILAWNYMRLFQKFKGACAYNAPKNKKSVSALRKLRDSIFSRIDKLI